jgi:hypothetical protein
MPPGTGGGLGRQQRHFLFNLARIGYFFGFAAFFKASMAII